MRKLALVMDCKHGLPIGLGCLRYYSDGEEPPSLPATCRMRKSITAHCSPVASWFIALHKTDSSGLYQKSVHMYAMTTPTAENQFIVEKAPKNMHSIGLEI